MPNSNNKNQDPATPQPPSQSAASDRIAWRDYARTLGLTFAIVTALALAITVLANPYGNLPVNALGPHVIMDINQRYQYPALIRKTPFDSAVIGTSTSRLLDPDLLDKKLGGRFVNLAMNDGRAWEQIQMIKLLRRHKPELRTILIGLDAVWCDPNAYENRISKRGFPEWMFDENPINDLPYMLNGKTLEISGRRLAHAVGLTPARIPSNGFEVFVPDESEYDAARAKENVWRHISPEHTKPVEPPASPPPETKNTWKFPAVGWLDETLAAIPPEITVILAHMPVHITAQPRPGSLADVREQTCKARLTDVARRHGAHVVDFRISSSLTRNDQNYWDRLHYRLPVGATIIRGVSEALRSHSDDPNGLWHYFAGPADARSAKVPANTATSTP